MHAVRGDRIWKELQGRESTVKLILAALARSHRLNRPDGYTFSVINEELIRKSIEDSVAIFMEHYDGYKSSIFLFGRTTDGLLKGNLVRDFTYAGIDNHGKIQTCLMFLPLPNYQATLANFFNPLVYNIEKMILSGETPYPIERTLLTSGMTLFGIESLYQGEKLLSTPELKVAYEAPSESRFWRA